MENILTPTQGLRQNGVQCVLFCPSLVPYSWFLGILPLEGTPDPLFHRWENLNFRGDSGSLEVTGLTGDCADIASLAPEVGFFGSGRGVWVCANMSVRECFKSSDCSFV